MDREWAARVAAVARELKTDTEQATRTRTCPHCGAENKERLGECHVCQCSVCEHCGNVQYIKGERHVVHDECLDGAGDRFSMIKFVK